MHGCSPVNLLHIFRTPFSKNTSGWLFLYILIAELQIANYRPKTLTEYNSNIDFMIENLPKLVKNISVFGAHLKARPFLLKLKTVAVCFKLNIFHNTLRTTSMDKSILKCVRLLPK